MTTILKKYVDEFQRGRNLDGGEGTRFLDALIAETDESILVDVFRAWNHKGIAEDEIYSIAKIMRARCTKVVSRHETFVDIVGSGGSRSKTFNVSTAAAFVAAGCHVPVAKHGNKAATSNSGSADVLSALGIEPAVDAATAERCLNEIGICFMFAPNFHRLSPTLGKVRRGLGFPTIFNCVGPLCNPACAPHQLIGVWSHELVPKMANALARLGTRKSWIVHGHDGLDEISLIGPTIVAEVEGRSVKRIELAPKDFGVEPMSTEHLKVNSADHSAKMIRDVLEGGNEDKALLNLVAMNAASALYLSGRADDLKTAIGMSYDAIRNGAAISKLDNLAGAVAKLK